MNNQTFDRSGFIVKIMFNRSVKQGKWTVLSTSSRKKSYFCFPDIGRISSFTKLIIR